MDECLCKNIKLSNHISHTDDIHIVDEILIKLVSCSEDSVTILTQLSITDYQESITGKRTNMELINESDCLNLDFKTNNIQETKVNDKTYKIKLMSITKEIFEGQETLFPELLISY